MNELVDRLIKRWKDAKRTTDKSTESLLKVPDAAIVKALDIARSAEFHSWGPADFKSKPRRVCLTDDGKAAFESWTAGCPESDVIFKGRFGNPWGSHDQHRPMAAACKAAGIEPAIGMHTLAYVCVFPGAVRCQLGHRR